MTNLNLSVAELLVTLAAFELAKSDPVIRVGKVFKRAERKIEIALAELDKQTFVAWQCATDDKFEKILSKNNEG